MQIGGSKSDCVFLGSSAGNSEMREKHFKDQDLHTKTSASGQIRSKQLFQIEVQRNHWQETYVDGISKYIDLRHLRRQKYRFSHDKQLSPSLLRGFCYSAGP